VRRRGPECAGIILMESLVDRARKYVAKMPAAISGQNGHGATYHVACVLVQGFGLTAMQAMPLLKEYNERCEPPWSERELLHKLDGAEKAFNGDRGRGYLAKGMEFTPGPNYRKTHNIVLQDKKPEFEETALSKFAGELTDSVDLLWLASRSDQDPCTVTSARFLEFLYRHGENVLIFTDNKSQGEAIWPRDEIPDRGPHGVWFLAQPVDGKYHPNPRSPDKQGKPRMSRRSEESVMSWRYFVIESDKANLKQWLGALAQFPLRIAAIYSSGGRSLHALVKIDARTKGEWDSEKEAMKRALVVLGADLGAMSAVRLTRLPGCWRRRSLQKLLYINPDPPMRPICELAPRRDVLKPWLDWASLGISDADETGGAALTRALHYYAPVSEACRQALQRLSRAKNQAA
jgi:hypothetical protein